MIKNNFIVLYAITGILLSIETNYNFAMEDFYTTHMDGNENYKNSQEQIFLEMLAMSNQPLLKKFDDSNLLETNEQFINNDNTSNSRSKKRSREKNINEQDHKKRKIDTSEKKEENSSYQEQNTNSLTTKPFQCTHKGCNKRFKRKIDLQDHMTVHSNEKPFQCEECNKAFKWKRVFQKHKKVVHSNERPYLCKYCNKSFKRKDYVNQHIEQIHFNKKSYHCSHCDKIFKLKNTLYKHIQAKHTENKERHCNYTNCDKIFETKSGLTKHIQVQHENIRYNCSLCNQSFTKQENLNIHITNHH